MSEIGVRELKTRASEIVRAIRERHARYLVTYRGRPVGVLMPLGDAGRAGVSGEGERAVTWEELAALGEEIGRGWQAEQSAVEILSEMRR